MTPVQRALRVALGWVALERQRARRAASIAARHEERAITGPQNLRAFHARLAKTHREAERRHRTAALVHESFADRLRLQGADSTGVLRVFMSAVAQAAGAQAAALTFFGPDAVESLAAASDGRAKSAQDLEFALGEGPAHASVTLRRAVWARGTELSERWPAFGPAVMDIGVRELVAVPVDLSGKSLGALTVFDPHGPPGEGEQEHERLRVIAQTLSQRAFDLHLSS